MTVPSAAHAAAPSFPLAAAFRPFDEVTGSGAQFAKELNRSTEAPAATLTMSGAAARASFASELNGAAGKQALAATPTPAAEQQPATHASFATELNGITVAPKTTTGQAPALAQSSIEQAPAATPAPAPEQEPATRASFATELNGIAEAPKTTIEQALAPAPEQQPATRASLASELDGITAAPKTTTEQALALAQSSFAATAQVTVPRTAAPAAGMIRPASAGAAKRPAPKPSAEGNQTATVPVLSAPILEIAPALTAPPTDDDDDTSNKDDSGVAVKPPALHAAPEEALEPAPPALTASAAPAQASPEMAFAARVQSTDNATHSTLPAEMASASAVASASKKIETTAQDEAAAPAEAHASMPIAAAVERASEPPSAHATPAAPAAPRTEAAASMPENVSRPATPLKDISFQVNQPGKERVDVRVVQQGGEVHVSVHSGDASLNTGLRQGLSELQSRLEETGYRSEIWRPGMATAPVASAVSPQASGNHARGGDGQPQQQGGSQQEGGRRNPQSNQPRWVEEMESSFDAGEKSTGGFYGFSS